MCVVARLRYCRAAFRRLCGRCAVILLPHLCARLCAHSFARSGGQFKQTYNGAERSGGAAAARPSTASRVQSANAGGGSASGPGTRPSTAYGLRTSGAPVAAAPAAASSTAGGKGSEHVVAGARGMMRYRRTRAATDGQVDGIAWNGNGAAGGSAGGGRLPSGGNSKTLLQRKGEATPAWDHRPGSTGGTRSSTGAYKFDSRSNGNPGASSGRSSGRR